MVRWPQRFDEALGLVVLMLAAILVAVFAPQRSGAKDRDPIRLSFIVDFTSLLLFGPFAMMVIATSGAVAQGFMNATRSPLTARGLLYIASVVVATQAAGFVYVVAGSALHTVRWPWHGISIAAAVLVYAVIVGASHDLNASLLTGRTLERGWLKRALRSCPGHFIAAFFAVGLSAAIEQRAWGVLVAAALPMYFAYRAYTENANRKDGDAERREVMDALAQGVGLVDGDGQVAWWNDALERLIGCPRERVLGRSVDDAIPALAQSALPQAIADALADRRPRKTPTFTLRNANGAKSLWVELIPAGEDVTLLWHDVTELPRPEPVRPEPQARRDGDWLALAAEGAHDGLWAWDRRTHEFHVSSRWQEMVGLASKADSARCEEWFDRVHPDDVVTLKEKLDAHVSGRTDHFKHEHRMRHEDGTYRWFLCRGVASRDAEGRADRIAGSLTDITEQTNTHARIRGAGASDSLTGLSNRNVFVERLGKALRDFNEEHRGRRFAVLYLDLDRFKLVNDSLGHLVGDELLIAVSRRLELCLRPMDALARLGGDEFAILLNGLNDDGQANVVAFRIQEALSAPFSIGGREVFTSVSIGIAFSRAEYTNPEEIMRDADTAMYHAKSQGKARHELFDADMHAKALDRLGLEGDLRHAVKNNALEVHYQPIVALTTGMCCGFEALIRWNRGGKPVSPAEFIPVAEELGLIEPLGAWVLEESCQRFADWQQRFPAAGLDCITVNVSARQLMQHGFVRQVEQTIQNARIRPRSLRLEITETALMGNPHQAAEVIRRLRDYGVKIYLDDFGTGYSSLNHLHKLPVDALKIDRSFVRSLLASDRPAIVESILALARTLDTGVVAEGVESELQAYELERLGCRYAQGFFFSPPIPSTAVEQLLIEGRPLGRIHAEPLAAVTDV